VSDLTTKGKATFHKDVEVRGKTLKHGGQQFVLGTLDGQKQMSKKGNRALVHHSSPTDSLHINFDGDFEGGVVVAGPKTLVEGALVSKGQVTLQKNLEVGGSTIVLGKMDKKKQGSRGKNRALKHGSSDRLHINVKGDFEGGTVVEGKGMFVSGNIAVGKKFTRPRSEIHVQSSKQTMGMTFSHKRKKKNRVFVQGKAASSGIDMMIGSTSGSSGYGRMIFDFKSDVLFIGQGANKFKNGDVQLENGKLAIGKRALGAKYGLTIETAEKPGNDQNDLAVNRGSVMFYGALRDISDKKQKWWLDLDKNGHIKAVNVDSKLGVGTQLPINPFGDTKKALIHVADKVRPVIHLQSMAAKGHATIAFKSGSQQFAIDTADKVMKFTQGTADILVLDGSGKVGFGRKNEGKYGMNVHLAVGANNPLNDLALPHGNIRMKGKIYDTFDGGDTFYLDPSKKSHVRDVTLDGKLSFKGVKEPRFHIELPTGDAHIALGRSLFLNGFGGDSGRITNNAIINKKGGWALHDPAKLASAIEMRNNGKIEMYTTKQAGKMNWELLLGMDGVAGAVYSLVNFGIGTKKPQHKFHMPGGENTMSIGNNLFITGTNDVSRITTNAYIKKKQWVIQRKDRFASSIDLKTDGRLEMYGTETQGAVQWKKMFGFNTPKNVVYALGKLGIGTEKPSETLTIPSGGHHISLGDKMFLNGQGAKSRIMGNCRLQLGKVATKDKARQAINVELDTAKGQMNFAGTRSKGADEFIHLLQLDFTKKSMALRSGRFGIRTNTPKTSMDVRGQLNLQDASNAGVIYTPSSGPGLFIRSSDTPGKYKSSMERFFFGNNFRAGFGTNKPQAKLHITHQKTDITVPHLKLETTSKRGPLEYNIHGTKDGLKFSTPMAGQMFKFQAGEATMLQMVGKDSEATVDGLKYKESTIQLAPEGGRAAVGGAPKGPHSLSVIGNGVSLSGSADANTGVMAFANDGGGDGFQLDYLKGKMHFSTLPPTKHLSRAKALKVHMTITDSGKIGIGTKTPSSGLTVKSVDGITVENKAGGKWGFKTSEDGHLEFISSKGGYFKVDEKGGLHLSKKHSDYKLEVEGKGMMLSGDSTGKAPLVFNADGGGKGFQMDYYKEKMMLGHGNGKKWHMTMTDDGLIGVGTPSPTNALHVKHNAGIAIEHGTKSLKWTVATAENAHLNFAYNGKPLVSYTKAGYVGIGTDKPKNMLHVEGDAYIAGKMHIDNWYTKKMAAQTGKKPKLEQLSSAEALIQLDAHVSAKMEDNSVGLVHADPKLESSPVDFASLVTALHRVAQDQKTQIEELKARVAKLEHKM